MVLKHRRTMMKKTSSSRQTPLMWMLICFLFSTVSFYSGCLIGWKSGKNTADGESGSSTHLRPLASTTAEAAQVASLSRLLDDANAEISQLKERERKLELELKLKGSENTNEFSHHSEIFDQKHTGGFASGLEFVDRDGFASVFDTGVPLDESALRNDQVLLLYSDPSAFPEEKKDGEGLLSAEEATANCLNMHLVLTQPRRQQCIAVMGQYESFHVHKYMRISGNRGDKINPNLPLKYVSRGHQQNGRISPKVPEIEAQKQNWESLVSYIQSLDKATEDLKPLLDTVASHNDHNTVIVMVCNFGQSELLLNFVCNARAKGLEDVLSNIFLFATDQATHELAQSMGITSIYIESIFGGMPEGAAKAYADKTFRKIMIAKVYCIQLVSMLGYDILFQDVDVVWYQNPLTWFHDESNPHYGFDMYFQDDGNHAHFYAPYSANTGFYYVRNNERTQYFFNSFLMAGDKILGSGSHQIPLIVHLSEQASINGLRVKIWDRKRKEFPGGYTFHKKQLKGLMKDIMSDEKDSVKDTYIFHMSWTKSKVDKVKYYQQMGEWYLQDVCIQKSASEIPKDCCAASPMVTCHYRDKPSKIPCKDSEPIDKGGPSWW